MNHDDETPSDTTDGVPARDLLFDDAPPQAPPEPPPAPQDGAAERRARARVLVADDEAPLTNFLTEAFANFGVTITVASDGAAAMDAFEAATPDMILCDLLLPKRNGFQLLEHFRTHAPLVPVVAMSGIYRPEKYTEELAHLPLFLKKPLDMSSVEPCIAILDRHLASKADAPAAAVTTPALPKATQREPWISASVLPLPRLLHLLWKDRRTGLVTLRAGQRQIVFMIQDGRLRFARSNDEELRLDRVLLQLGRCTQAALDAARAELESRRTPTRLGEVLVEQGVIERADLDKAIGVQVRRIIASAFSETKAQILFRADALPEGEDVLLDSDLRGVIVSGCQSLRDAGDVLLAHLPDGACRVERGPSANAAELKLPATIARLVEAIDSPMRLSDVASMADLVGLRGRSILFGLLCAEVLAISSEQESWSGGLLHATTPRTVDLSPMEAALEIEARQATGILRVTWANVVGWLAFEDGRIVQGGSSDARTRIGGLLRAAGLLTPEQLEKALREQGTKPGRPLGNVLLEMGLLSPSALRHAVSAQVLWVARDMFSRAEWSTASFTENEAPEKEPVDIEPSVTDVVLDTLRQMDEKLLIDLVRVLAPGRPALDLAALTSGRFELTEGEEVIASALSSATQQVIDALTDAERLDLEVMRVLAMALLVSKRTETAARPAVAETTAEDDAVIEVVD